MKELSDIALVGLERAGSALPDSGDDLVSKVPATSGEGAFLLRLGVAAVRARAGRTAGRSERPPPAAAETRPACSEALARIVADLCRERAFGLLAEALAKIDGRGMRLPAWCLVDLAEVTQPALQAAAGRVAGERGRWLAAQNPAWRWLVEGEAAQSPVERTRTWEEGSLPGRLAALRAVRIEAPAEGRSWVESVWKQEKAAVREALVNALEEGLCADDEPVLARALVDRAAQVRAAAARLLARLETSALAGRMRTRADALLAYQPPASGVRGVLDTLKARLAGHGDGGTLDVIPPSAFAAGWAEDGLVEKPPAGTGEKAYWVLQILALVPPDHWSSRFGVAPEALVAAARRSEWSAVVLGGWAEAAAMFRSAAWAAALWRGYAADGPSEQLAALAPRLLPILPGEQAEGLATPLVASGDPVAFLPALAALPAPWGQAFGETFLETLSRGQQASSSNWQRSYAWKVCLEKAATSLPPGCFARALESSARASDDGPAASALRGGLESFHTVVATRQRIHQETLP